MLYLRVVFLLFMSVSCFSKMIDGEDAFIPSRTLELYQAIENENIKAFDSLIEQGAKVNTGIQVGNKKSSLLRYAIEEKKPIAIIQKLIGAGANISNRTLRLAREQYPQAYKQLGTARLYAAIKNEDTEAVNRLIEQGANVNVRFQVGNKQFTPLRYAIEGKKTKAIIQKLISAGAKISDRALRLAYRKNHEAYQTILTLLAQKADQSDQTFVWEKCPDKVLPYERVEDLLPDEVVDDLSRIGCIFYDAQEDIFHDAEE